MNLKPVAIPVRLSGQFWAAAALGALGACVAAVLEVLSTVNARSVGTFLPFALALAIVIGSMVGIMCLAAGQIVRRALQRSAKSSWVPAGGAAVTALLLGAGMTYLIVLALIPQMAPFGWVPILASLIGAVGLYFVSLPAVAEVATRPRANV
jgi:hypothetical protein